MPRRKPNVSPSKINCGASDDAGATPIEASDGVPPTQPAPDTDPPGEAAPTAFDLFVERGLHAIYDGVLAEPIPDELLRLIEDDRRK